MLYNIFKSSYIFHFYTFSVSRIITGKRGGGQFSRNLSVQLFQMKDNINYTICGSEIIRNIYIIRDLQLIEEKAKNRKRLVGNGMF